MSNAKLGRLEPTNSLILVDAHVHFRKCFDIGKLLSQAATNFKKYSGLPNDISQSNLGCLLLTETDDEEWFPEYYRRTVKSSGKFLFENGWTLKNTSENFSLQAVHCSGEKLMIFAGRQIVTRENLEVLALLTPDKISDGLSLENTLKEAISIRSIPVLPWGVGKWLGIRGKLVRRYLLQNDSKSVFLGDNGGRPLGWNRPPLFKLADKKGIAIFPGTDPLPLRSEYRRVGSFGFKIRGELNPQRPGETLYQQLSSFAYPIETYGRLDTPWSFCKNQISLRLGG